MQAEPLKKKKKNRVKYDLNSNPQKTYVSMKIQLKVEATSILLF